MSRDLLPRNRSMVTTSRKTRQHPKRIRERAAFLYVQLGSYEAVARELGISSKSTINYWAEGTDANREEWASWIDRFQTEYDAETMAQLRSVVRQGYSEALDRLQNGDVVLTKDGQERVPMKGKDAAVIASIATDKLRLASGKPTRITATTDALGKAAAAFQELASQYRSKVVSDQ